MYLYSLYYFIKQFCVFTISRASMSHVIAICSHDDKIICTNTNRQENYILWSSSTDLRLVYLIPFFKPSILAGILKFSIDKFNGTTVSYTFFFYWIFSISRLIYRHHDRCEDGFFSFINILSILNILVINVNKSNEIFVLF